jgi:hypothetical protein
MAGSALEKILWPDQLLINARASASATPSALNTNAIARLLGKEETGRPRFRLAPEKLADAADWKDPRVGWGVVLADGASIPDALQQLIEQRSTPVSPAPVLYYLPGPSMRGFLRRNGQDLPISTAPRGLGPGAIPKYLLIYGTPEDIPWQVQYHLNAVCCVGRLTLTGTSLENYIKALLTNWAKATARTDTAVVWAVEYKPSDAMTTLMRQAIAQPVFNCISKDGQLANRSQLVAPSTTESLIRALEERRPGLIVTTSHGQTAPLDDIAQMSADLGLLVDTNERLLRGDELLQKWQPSGAIWYAHACCSAGCDATSLFDGIAAPGTEVDLILKSLTRIGARAAPFPEALLGAEEPLRAFVGHVEPTFDWMLRQRFTGQYLTDPIKEALYDRLYQPMPLGLALRSIYEQLGAIYAEYDENIRVYNEDANNAPNVLYHAMLARDVQSLVVLGDPTAMLAALPNATAAPSQP